MKWGILSTGTIAKNFAQTAKQMPDVQVQAVASRSAGSAKAFAETFAIPTAHDSYEALANDPDVLIMDEPTRGIDVGAKHEIYEIMSDLAKQGKAIIMISSEMSELLGMADRICVMCNGKLTGEIDQPEEMTQARVMGFATKF